MANQDVVFCTNKKLDCCPQASVVVCVPEVLTATGFGYINATLTAVSAVSNSCGVCQTAYTFTYDDTQLLDPNTPLTSAEVSGAFCMDCFTTWVQSITGNPELIGWACDLAGNFVQNIGATGNVVFRSKTSNIQLLSGSNGRTGVFNLNGAVPVTINNTSLTSNDQIIISRDTPSGTLGAWNLTARTNGTGFQVTGTALDTSGMRYTLLRIN